MRGSVLLRNSSGIRACAGSGTVRRYVDPCCCGIGRDGDRLCVGSGTVRLLAADAIIGTGIGVVVVYVDWCCRIEYGRNVDQCVCGVGTVLLLAVAAAARVLSRLNSNKEILKLHYVNTEWS